MLQGSIVHLKDSQFWRISKHMNHIRDMQKVTIPVDNYTQELKPKWPPIFDNGFLELHRYELDHEAKVETLASGRAK